MIACIQSKVSKCYKECVEKEFTRRVSTVAGYELRGNAPHADPDKKSEEGLFHVITDRRLHLITKVFLNCNNVQLSQDI